MDSRDHQMHRALTRLHHKFEQLDLVQAEQHAAIGRRRLEREGRWPHTDAAVARATTP